MQSSLKAGFIVFATFVLGGAVGALGAGALAQSHRRLGPLPMSDAGRPPMGFAELVEDVLQPHDSMQRTSVRPILEVADRRNRAIVDSARASMRAVLDSLRVSLAPLLDPEQLEAFDELVRGQTGDRRGRPEFSGPPAR